MTHRTFADPRPLLALAIDDDPMEVEILSRHLQAVPDLDVQLVHAPDRDTAEALLRERPVDLIFLDYHLGPESGVDLLESLRRRGDLRPVVVLTGRGDEYAAAGLMSAGADRYLVKGDLGPELAREAIEAALERSRQREAEREALRNLERLEYAQRRLEERNHELERLSGTDPLTGLANRRQFMQRAEAELARIGRQGGCLALVMMDVDHFKKVNDVHGHLVGDEVLMAIGGALDAHLRCYDVAARLGGEEFALLLPEARPAGTRAVTERCRRAIADIRLPVDRIPDRVTVSAGIAYFPGPGLASLNDLMGAADQALYEAKHRGRDRVVEARLGVSPEAGRPEA